MPEVLHEDMAGLERGGVAYLRDGAGSAYKRCWLHTHERKLFIFAAADDDESTTTTTKFEQIDLLRITRIRECVSVVVQTSTSRASVSASASSLRRRRHPHP